MRLGSSAGRGESRSGFFLDYVFGCFFCFFDFGFVVVVVVVDDGGGGGGGGGVDDGDGCDER
jgi:hypothetical protein